MLTFEFEFRMHLKSSLLHFDLIDFALRGFV
jgi:hypothetical protein